MTRVTLAARPQRLSEMGRHNSIGFIRLVAALLVIVGHSFPYGGYGTDPLIGLTHNQLAIGRFPVDVFFALSGFLITMSFFNSGSWAMYAWHRFLRIYPALIVCLALTAFVLAPLMGDGPGLPYFLRNVTLVPNVADTIPGLFTDTPGRGSVNSSLWTLPWEMRAYALVLILGVVGLLRRVWVVAAMAAVCWVIFAVQVLSNPGIQTSPAVTSGFRLLAFFFVGALFYLLRDRIAIRGSIFVASLAVLVAATVIGYFFVPYSAGLFYLVAPVPLTYCVFWLAVRLPLQRINTDYDFSYGIYIYGTLLLNLYASLALGLPWWAYLALTVVTTLLVAAASWYLVEKPAMSLKDVRVRLRGGVALYRLPARMTPRPRVGSGSPADV